MNTTRQQKIADLLQAYQIVVMVARRLYNEEDVVKKWAVGFSQDSQSHITEIKNKLKEWHNIDYDKGEKQIIKEGSEVNILVNHMDGMKGSKGKIFAYSLPAAVVDITMEDMKMMGHKWLTNDEVKL